MKYLAAYALLTLAGNTKIDAAAVKKVLTEAGAEVNDSDLNRVITALSGKALHEVIAAGLTKVGSVSSSAPVSGGNSAPAKAADKKEEKKEVKKEEPKVEEEEDVDMGGLFGDF